MFNSIYWSTGIQYEISFSLKGETLCFGEQNLKKYHDESTNVSKVSVSQCAFATRFVFSFFQLT